MTVTTKPLKEAHFATFPVDLIEQCELEGCPIDGLVLDLSLALEQLEEYQQNIVLIS